VTPEEDTGRDQENLKKLASLKAGVSSQLSRNAKADDDIPS